MGGDALSFSVLFVSSALLAKSPSSACMSFIFSITILSWITESVQAHVGGEASRHGVLDSAGSPYHAGGWQRQLSAGRSGQQADETTKRPGAQSYAALGKAGKLGLTGLAPIDEEGDEMPGGDWRGGPGRTGAGGLAKGGLFEAKYKNKQASSYCTTLQQRVQAVCGAFECNRGLPFDVAQQDLQVDQFLERPAPAKVRLRDPPTREEILQAKMDASRMSKTKSRGDSTISGSSRFGTNTTRSSGASSRNLSSARSKDSAGMRSGISSNKSKASSSGASSRWSSSVGSSRQASSNGDETSRTRRGSNEDRRAHQPSQIHTI